MEEKQAHYLLVVKANQLALFATLRALPWREATGCGTTARMSHSRR
ncbi:hypothetical protein [Streptomyces regalis]|nr:hypothetical protein [Streptomyces regalis]